MSYGFGLFLLWVIEMCVVAIIGLLAWPERKNKMSYDYAVLKPDVFTEDNQKLFLKIRDQANVLLANGAARMDAIIANCGGDNWTMMACVDRLVELGEVRELKQDGECFAQHRLFVRA